MYNSWMLVDPTAVRRRRALPCYAAAQQCDAPNTAEGETYSTHTVIVIYHHSAGIKQRRQQATNRWTVLMEITDSATSF